jgi:hypothetical protein
MQRLTMEIPLSRARLCVNCENIFDTVASSTFCCPVCAGQSTASIEAWLNRVPPIGVAEPAATMLHIVSQVKEAQAA